MRTGVYFTVSLTDPATAGADQRSQWVAKIKTDLSELSPQTQLVTAGREYSEHGFVNPAVYYASTVLFPTAEALRERDQLYVYGRYGTHIPRGRERGGSP